MWLLKYVSIRNSFFWNPDKWSFWLLKILLFSKNKNWGQMSASILMFNLFLAEDILFYWLWYWYYSCLKFYPFVPLQPALPLPSGNPHTLVHVHGSYINVLWLLYSLCCTLHPCDYSVTTNLFFIPHLFNPSSWPLSDNSPA